MVEKNKKRVILAMSSGVDSSASAALLQEQGYEVIGIFMHFWKEPEEQDFVENKCCSLEALEDAKRVANVLGIPLYTVNAEKEFKKEVVDYFINEYKAGRTPNPCVACNPKIKFKVLFEKMLELKGDFVASGHYARIRREILNPKSQILNTSLTGPLRQSFSEASSQESIKNTNSKKVIYKLLQGVDKNKDQTYFLYNLNQKQLSKIIFPVGKYQKTEIREIAKKFNLPVFDKEDSQGICFTREKYPTEFLKRNIAMEAGKIVDTSGKEVGTHQGLALYTIGQRRGINIGGDGPYYVVGKDMKKNLLIVTNDEKNPDLYRKEITVINVDWINGEPVLPLEISVKVRYRKPEVCAIIREKKVIDGKVAYIVEFKELQMSIAPGQSAVFYDNEEVIGGGEIK